MYCRLLALFSVKSEITCNRKNYLNFLFFFSVLKQIYNELKYW